MDTAILSAIIVSLVATTLFVLPLAIVCLVVVFVPTTQLAAVRRLLLRRTHSGELTPTTTDVRELPAEPATDDLGTSDGPSVVLSQPPRLGYFVIETVHVERTRLLVEMFLERETKRWRLDGSTRTRKTIGQIPKVPVMPSTLLYLVRFRRNTRPESLRDRLKAIGESSDFTVRLERGEDDLVARSA